MYLDTVRLKLDWITRDWDMTKLREISIFYQCEFLQNDKTIFVNMTMFRKVSKFAIRDWISVSNVDITMKRIYGNMANYEA